MAKKSAKRRRRRAGPPRLRCVVVLTLLCCACGVIAVPLLLVLLLELDEDPAPAPRSAAAAASSSAPVAAAAAAVAPDNEAWRPEAERSEQTIGHFAPKKSSLTAHVEPSWFRRAKIGLSVQWGAHSALAWTPSVRDSGCEWMRSAEAWRRDRARIGTREWHACNPLRAWYGHAMRVEGAPAARRHARLHSNRTYAEMVSAFVATAAAWAERGGAEEWGAFFAERSGARYVVVTARGVDGVSLWPSAAARAHAARPPVTTVDVLHLVQRAVKRRGLRFGVRVAAGINWASNGRARGGRRSAWGLHRASPKERPRVAAGEQCFAMAQYAELIERLAPDVLWNDFGFPRLAPGDAPCPHSDSSLGWPEVLAAFYNARPSGVVNDRWSVPYRQPPLYPPGEALQCADFDTTHSLLRNSSAAFADRTIRAAHWELPLALPDSADVRRTRAQPHSALIHTIADVVSKNGNVLLSVTPMSNGTLPRAQKRALLHLGKWLRKNGDALFDTVPLIGHTCCAETHTIGRHLRFTQSLDGAVVWAIVLMDLHSVGGRGVSAKQASAGARCNRLLGKSEKKCMHLIKVIGLRVLPGAVVTIHDHCVRVKVAQVHHARESHWETHIILPHGVAKRLRGQDAFAIKINGSVTFEPSSGAGYTVGCPRKEAP